MKYENVYWSRAAMELDGGVQPSILAVGDSWFWYPFPGGSLIQPLGDLLRPRGHTVLVEGNNGAEAYDYVKGKYKRQVNEMLRLYGGGAQALLISGGGNDFAGYNDLRPLLVADASGAATAADCFRPGQDEGTVGWLMSKMAENYAILVTRAIQAMPAGTPILVHTYDYAIPSGKGVLRGAAWLKPALDAARVPPPLQAGCVRLLIDRAHGVLAALAANPSANVHLVDSRGLLGPADWANELHPRGAGFRRLARYAWRPVLVALGLA
jgi:hypothetical protein